MPLALDKDTLIEARQGMVSRKMKWSRFAFEFVGSKHKEELERLHTDLTSAGCSEWQGIAIFNLSDR